MDILRHACFSISYFILKTDYIYMYFTLLLDGALKSLEVRENQTALYCIYSVPYVGLQYDYY